MDRRTRLEIIDKHKIEEEKNKKELAEIKVELIKQEYQDNLQSHMENRLCELISKLKNLKGNKLSVMELKTLISEKNIVGISPKYSNTELSILFNYYKEFVLEINQYTTYLPTKQNFCSFAGISTNAFDRYKISDDEERREIAQQIEDYITDVMLTSAQKGDIREISTMFRAKTEHGYVEAQAPIVIEHKTEADIDDIMKQIEAVNRGKSLKDINMKKNKSGVYVPVQEGDK